MKTRLLSLITFLTLFCTIINAQVIDIATAKTQAVGSTITVQGVVLDEGQFNASLRYIQDATAAIAIYDADAMPGLLPGTLIEVTGSYSPFNELSEIVSVTNIQTISTGEPLPSPAVFDNIADAFTETYECSLVTLNNVTFVDQGNFNTGTTNYEITDGTTTQAIRVYGASDIAGTPIPSEAINITGVMGQYNSTYQFQPLSLSNFDFNSGAPIFSSGLTQSNITTNSFDVCFETLNDGNTIINYSPNPLSLSGEISDLTLTTNHCITLNNLQPATLYYIQATSEGSNGDASESSVQVMMTASLSSGTMNVYFNKPVDNSVSSGTNAVYVSSGMADTIISYINAAQSTLDIAYYNMDNDNGIIDAINNAYNNGVTVRVVAHSESNSTSYNLIQIGSGNKKLSPTPAFQGAPSGGSYALMHNKFIIVDAASTNNSWITSGSMNFTDSGINSRANNFIAIQDESLAKAYTVEFNEMFEDNTFGPEKADNTPKLFSVAGKTVELYFSPSDDTEKAIKASINTADTDIYVAMNSYTRFGISYEIEDLLDDNVFVAGLVEDATGSSSSTDAFEVLNDDIPDTWLDFDGGYTLHHKYMIVDPNAPNSDPMVLTGSHNWSGNAQFSNDENTLIIHDATIANIYYQEWRRRYTDNGGNIFLAYADNFENNKVEIFDLFPNPANNNLNFAFKVDENFNYNISIVDITGKTLIAQNNKTANVGLNSNQFDLTTLTSGLYILNFECENFNHSKPFIVK